MDVTKFTMPPNDFPGVQTYIKPGTDGFILVNRRVLAGAASGSIVDRLLATTSAFALSIVSGPASIDENGNLVLNEAAGEAGDTRTIRIKAERADPFKSIQEDVIIETVLGVPVAPAADPVILSEAQSVVSENAHLAFTLIADQNVTWAIGDNDAAMFELSGTNPATSITLRWAGDGVQDYETPIDQGANNNYSLTIQATSVATGLSTQQAHSTTVTDVGEATNTLVISGTPTASVYATKAYNTWTPDVQGGTAPLVFSLVGTWPEGMTINTSTGAPSGSPGTAGTYAGLVIRVTDADGFTKDLGPFTITVLALPTLVDLTFSNLTFSEGSASAFKIADITGQTAGTTIAITPNDGRLALNTDLDELLVGLTASSAGSVAYTVTQTHTASGVTHSQTISVVCEAASQVPVTLDLENKGANAVIQSDGLTFSASADPSWVRTTASFPTGSYKMEVTVVSSSISVAGTIGVNSLPWSSYHGQPNSFGFGLTGAVGVSLGGYDDLVDVGETCAVLFNADTMEISLQTPRGLHGPYDVTALLTAGPFYFSMKTDNAGLVLKANFGQEAWVYDNPGFDMLTEAGEAPPVGASAPMGPTAFLLGNWLQEPSSLDTWAARGINTALYLKDDDFGFGGATLRSAAADAGLKLIIRPDHNAGESSLLADSDDPNVLCHMTWDEPEGNAVTDTDLAAEAAAWRTAGSTKAIGVGFRGSGPGLEQNGYSNYLSTPNVDWEWSDIYSFGGEQETYYFGDLQSQYGYTGNFTTMVGKSARTLRLGPYQGDDILYPNRHIFQFLASGRVGDKYGQPGVPKERLTAVQHSTMFWSAVANGCSGLFYFSHYMAGDPAQISDDTDSVMDAAIADAVAKINILQDQGGENVLMDTVNGGRRAYTFRPCCKTSGGTAGATYPAVSVTTIDGMFQTPTGLEMQAWFEGFEVVVGAETYRVAVNIDAERSHDLTDSRWGMEGVTFAPGQVCCFKASEPAVDLFDLSDATPAALVFASNLSAALDTDIVVRATLSGTNINTSMTALTGDATSYSINGGAFATTLPVDVPPGATIDLKGHSSTSNSTSISVGCTIGGVTSSGGTIKTVAEAGAGPMLVSPSAGYDGTADSGTIAPFAAVTRTTAAPIIQFHDIDRCTFTGERVIGVYARCAGGLDDNGVQFNVGGTVHNVTTPTLYEDTCPRGLYRARWGYWLKIQSSDYTGFASGAPTLRIYAKATPADSSMQARVIGYTTDNTLFELYPRTAENDSTWNVRLDGAGGAYTSIKLAMAAAATAGKKTPLILIKQNGFYQLEDGTWTAVSDGKGNCDIRCDEGIAATVGRSTMPAAPTRSLWTWDPRWSWIRFGKGITVDVRNFHTIKTSAGAYPTLHGATLTNSIGTRDTLYYFKGPHPGLTGVDQGGTDVNCRYLDVDRYYQRGGSFSDKYQNIQAYREIDGVRTGIKFTYNIYERETDPRFYTEVINAFSVTGPSGATIERNGNSIIIKDPSSTTIKTYAISNDPADVYYNTDAIADDINATLSGSGYAATKSDNTRNSGSIWPNWANNAPGPQTLSATPVAVETQFDIHSEYRQVAGHLSVDLRTNHADANVTLDRCNYSTASLNWSGSFDTVLENFQSTGTDGGYASPVGPGSHFLCINSALGGVLLYGDAVWDEYSSFEQTIVGYMAPMSAASSGVWQAYPVFKDCVFGQIAGVITDVLPNNANGLSSGNTKLGTTDGTAAIDSYYVDPANGNFLPSATALANLKPKIRDYDGINQLVADNDAITPWSQNSTIPTWRAA